MAPMPHLAMLGVGCPLWVGASANALNFQGQPPPGAKKSLGSMPTAQRRQKIAKMSVGAKNSQLQGLSGKELLAAATNCKNQPGTLVGMSWQGFGRQGECSKSGGLPNEHHLDLSIFLGWAAFHRNFLLWAATLPPCQCA